MSKVSIDLDLGDVFEQRRVAQDNSEEDQWGEAASRGGEGVDDGLAVCGSVADLWEEGGSGHGG